MRFTTFLATLVGGSLPKTRVKNDLINFKQLFKYADKDSLYENLIDNIFWLLETKFGKFELIYNSLFTAYNELSLMVQSQIPQFMFVQKKQLLESLDTFAELQNWGSVTKDNVKRIVLGDDTDTTSTGYVPINGQDTDPLSKNTLNRKYKSDEKTDFSRNTSDFLSFFSRMKWNTASIDLEKILKPYYSLFITMVVPNTVVGDPGGGDAGELDELKKQVEALSGVVQQNTSSITRFNQSQGEQDVKISSNTTSISGNTGRIGTLTQQLSNKVDRSTADALYLTQSKGDARYIRQGSTGDYLTKNEASNTYLTQVSARNTYLTQSYANSYLANKSDIYPLRNDIDSNTRKINFLSQYRVGSNRLEGRNFGWRSLNSGITLVFYQNITKEQYDNLVGMSVKFSSPRISFIGDSYRTELYAVHSTLDNEFVVCLKVTDTGNQRIDGYAFRDKFEVGITYYERYYG